MSEFIKEEKERGKSERKAKVTETKELWPGGQSHWKTGWQVCLFGQKQEDRWPQTPRPPHPPRKGSRNQKLRQQITHLKLPAKQIYSPWKRKDENTRIRRDQHDHDLSREDGSWRCGGFSPECDRSKVHTTDSCLVWGDRRVDNSSHDG